MKPYTLTEKDVVVITRIARGQIPRTRIFSHHINSGGPCHEREARLQRGRDTWGMFRYDRAELLGSDSKEAGQGQGVRIRGETVISS